MDAPESLASLDREELLALVTELRQQVAALTASHAAWRVEIEQLTRGGKRQAAPFSKGTRVAKPKPSGRKPGIEGKRLELLREIIPTLSHGTVFWNPASPY